MVTVPEDLSVLVNMLAENNHNVWAMERIKQGWKYGSASVRDPVCVCMCVCARTICYCGLTDLLLRLIRQSTT